MPASGPICRSGERQAAADGFRDDRGKRYPPLATAIEERGDGIVSAGFGDGHAGFGISRGIARQGDFARRPDDRLRCRQHRPRPRPARHRHLHVLRSSGQARHRDHDDPRRQGRHPADHRLGRHVGIGCRARLDGRHRARDCPRAGPPLQARRHSFGIVAGGRPPAPARRPCASLAALGAAERCRYRRGNPHRRDDGGRTDPSRR